MNISMLKNIRIFPQNWSVEDEGGWNFGLFLNVLNDNDIFKKMFLLNIAKTQIYENYAKY